jgi:hypothetical protein
VGLLWFYLAILVCCVLGAGEKDNHQRPHHPGKTVFFSCFFTKKMDRWHRGFVTVEEWALHYAILTLQHLVVVLQYESKRFCLKK